MGNSIFGIGLSGLNAAQAGLATAGHNISNVNTVGFNRQEVQFASNQPQYSGAGFFGNGVSVQNIRRSYDSLLQSQTWGAQSSASHLQSYADQIGRIDSLLADPSVGLSPALSSFFAAVHDVAVNPSDTASRQGMLSQAQTLSARFQQLDSQFEARRDDANATMMSVVDQVNTTTDSIAELNHRIEILKTSGDGTHTPNDLLDKRDQLITDLSKLVRAQVVKQDDGSYNVFLGSGQPLVVKDNANKLVLLAGDSDPRKMQIGLQGGGSALKLGTTDMAGGQLGGMLEFLDKTLDPAQNALGRIAMALGAGVNEQNQLGQDLNGALGGAIFRVGAPDVLSSDLNTGNGAIGATVASLSALTTSDYKLKYDGSNYTLTRLSDGNATTFASFPQTVDGVTLSLSSGVVNSGDSFLVRPTRAGASGMSVLLKDVSRIAAAAPIRTNAALANSSGVAISAGSVNAPAPPNANLQQPVTITFTGAGTFDVSGTGTGNPTGVAYTAGANISYNGWTVQISGTPVAGDVFTVSANTGGTGDNRNALALANLQTATLLNSGNDTMQTSYSQLVSEIGNKAQEIKITSSAQDSLLASVEQARQGITGVNLDEEATNLLRYQQAYQASGKVIAIAGTLFDTILRMG